MKEKKRKEEKRREESRRREEKRREEKRREEKRREEKDGNRLSDINLASLANSWNNLSMYFIDNGNMACTLPYPGCEQTGKQTKT